MVQCLFCRFNASCVFKTCSYHIADQIVVDISRNSLPADIVSNHIVSHKTISRSSLFDTLSYKSATNADT